MPKASSKEECGSMIPTKHQRNSTYHRRSCRLTVQACAGVKQDFADIRTCLAELCKAEGYVLQTLHKEL